MTYTAKPFDRDEERRLLNGWFGSVAFDQTPTGIPALEPDDNDDEDEAADEGPATGHSYGGAMSVDLHMQGHHDQLSHGNRKLATDQPADPAADPGADPAAAPAPDDSVGDVPEHKGAMIALIPSAADADRLAVDGGEPSAELHCTLAYLGDDASQIPSDVQAGIIANLTECLAGWPVVEADAFAVSLFNPGDVNDMEPCIALALSGADLQHVHGIAEEAIVAVVYDQSDTVDPGDLPEIPDVVVAADPPPVVPAAPADPSVPPPPVGPVDAGPAWEPPDQFLPWIPHVTLTWDTTGTQVSDLVDRVGPIVFDRVRIAFAGVNTDIPLSATPNVPGDGDPAAGPDDGSGYPVVSAGGQDWLSRMPDVLKRYWIKHLAPWGPGAFARCVPALRKYFPRDPKGTCANLHKEATGRWPGEDHSVRTETTMASPTTPAPMPAVPAGAGDDPCPDGQHTDPDTGNCVPDEPTVPAKPAGTTPAMAGNPTTPAAPAPAAPAGPGVPGGNPCPDGQHIDPTSGDCVPDDSTAPAPAPATTVEHFHAIQHVEGVSTGMRTFVPGSLTWRTPPYAFHWQRNSSAHGGTPETVQVGNVTRAERDPADNTVIHGWGNIDLDSPEGLDYARRLANGFSNWVSIGLDESPVEVEFVWPEGGDPNDINIEDGDIGALFAEPEQEVYHSGRIGELTAVSVPAQAEATIAPTQALLDELAARGVVMAASAVPPHETPTAGDSWDGAAAEAALPDPLPVATAKNMYAWYDDTAVDGDNIPKSGCKFPHHDVGADGQPGAANLAACSAVIGALHGGRGGADIPDTDRQGVYDHVAKHLTDGGQQPPALAARALVAAGHIIEIPNVPPAWWFQRPTDVTPHGALTVTDEGRIYGWLAPAGIAHRGFPGRRVTVPMGNVDYSRWMGGEAIVAGGGRIVAGPITMECGHMPPSVSSRSVIRMEHYDNTCSVAAKACIGEDRNGVWIAGALEPGVTAEQVSRMLACRLSGDWAPHPERAGWQEFVAALLVPVPGFPQGRSAPSVRVAGGALVASSVPVRFAHASADYNGPDLRPAMERVAKSIGRDRRSRLEALHAKVHGGR